MASGEKMAFRGKIRFFVKGGYILLIAVCTLFFCSTYASAAPTAPIITETDWMTGQIEVAYTGVTPGNTIRIYIRKHTDDHFYQYESWTAQASTEKHIVKFLENGQTYWFYITQVDPNSMEESPRSNEVRQTPPITAFIINWPDMLQNITDVIVNVNDDFKEYLDGVFTPTNQAINDLADAIDNLKDAIGVGKVDQIGGGLQTGFDGMIPGLNDPIVVDDGDGTYTGGSGGLNLPNPKNPDDLGLEVPDLDWGTDTDLTFKIPITKKMDGEFLYVKLFTEEQMEKMKWLGLLRTLAVATIYILFGVWLVTRFAPQLKS